MFFIVQLLLFGARYQNNVFLKYDAILSIAKCRQNQHNKRSDSAAAILFPVELFWVQVQFNFFSAWVQLPRDWRNLNVIGLKRC